MKVPLSYGRGHLEVEFPADRTTVIQPAPAPALANEHAAVLSSLGKPIGVAPLRDWLKPNARIVILFTDITRATPNDRLIPWLLEYLRDAGVAREQITLINQLGTHRPNTSEELEHLLTPEVTRDYRVLNHEPENTDALIQLGVTADGTPALLNRQFVQADVRIVTGFIEPHFFAGFSGGPKGIMPGVAGLRTVMSNHGARHIADPQAAFGITEGNPIWEEMRDIALRAGPSFLLNVSLDHERRITGVFAGDLIAAHKVGCEFVRASAMQRFDVPFDIVVTTNSGYPLDQNLYQAVKGMSAGGRVLKPGGTIIIAAECSEGVPAGSPFDRILKSGTNLEAILESIERPGPPRAEQWQAQIQALIQRRANVLLYSSLPDDQVRAAHIKPCHDIAAAVQQEVGSRQNGTRIAVLPQGPLTIPYLAPS